MSTDPSNAKGILQSIWQQMSHVHGVTQPAAHRHVHITDTCGSGKWFIASTLIKYSRMQDYFHVFITGSMEEAAYIENDISHLLPDKQVLLFPAAYEQHKDDKNKAKQSIRLEALLDVYRTKGKRHIWVIPFDALLESTPNIHETQESALHIEVNKTIAIDTCLLRLQEIGYEWTEFVSAPGQIAKRGGIVDIFSLNHSHPFRIELVDDQIVSLRFFHVETQLSIEKIASVEVLLHSEEKDSHSMVPLWKNLPISTCFWLDQTWEQHTQISANKPPAVVQSIQLWHTFLANQQTYCFGKKTLFENTHTLSIEQSPQHAFNNKFDFLIKDLRTYKAKGYEVFFSHNNPHQFERLQQIIEDLHADIRLLPLSFAIKEGFIDHQHRLLVYTDHQLFDRHHQYTIKQAIPKKNALSLKQLQSMQAGDYITHIDHGVGVFSGLQKIEVGGKVQEAIRIIYKDNDILYVNIHSLHKIARYAGKDGYIPSVHKLGSDAWMKVKQQTKSKVKKLAFDLIQLYAERKQLAAHAHSPDNYLQNELESTFVYEETPDQERAINEVKNDMQQSTPMDRLICGDVGFGKTEVAIRAAFKAILDGKQVAVLVPTTILAFQHFNTFKKRMDFFSPRIAFLNRFKTAKEKKDIKEQLKNGKIDIIIGTQALLGKDIVYNDLSLLIIDEEQKFGVGDKEKIKNIKRNVDCLTLTATPIPRTLQFSLMGARDLSIIQTPPPNRQPTHTELIAFDVEKIRELIAYETARSGQVFFIHNQVKDIADITHSLKQLLPQVNIQFAHGQMTGHDLEKTMLGFVNQEFDVLVCTNIVESGLDISNVNTIIINNAQQFGLSDLHQLRGRVGRSNKKSFCYLIIPPISTLTAEQKKRLEIIEEYTDLGSGFHIAMKDLDMRGAGNILGGEQSGFIAEMGFETYQKILNEAMQELHIEAFIEKKKNPAASIANVEECSIETDLSIYIPDSYITSSTERMEYYKKINDCQNDNDIEKIETELEDIFGKVPPHIKDLFTVVKCRWLAQTLGFQRIILKENQLRCYFPNDTKHDFYMSPLFSSILDFIQTRTNKIQIKQQGQLAYLSIREMPTIEDAFHLFTSMLKHHTKLA